MLQYNQQALGEGFLYSFSCVEFGKSLGCKLSGNGLASAKHGMSLFQLKNPIVAFLNSQLA